VLGYVDKKVVFAALSVLVLAFGQLHVPLVRRAGNNPKPMLVVSVNSKYGFDESIQGFGVFSGRPCLELLVDLLSILTRAVAFLRRRVVIEYELLRPGSELPLQRRGHRL